MSDAGKWSVPYVPKNPEILKAIARVTLRHNQLDEMLVYTIKSVANVTIEQAFGATLYQGSKTLRERVNKLARQRLGEGPALIKVQDLMERCALATLKRNELVHNVWSKDAAGGKPRVLHAAERRFKKPPTAKVLNELADELLKLVAELNHERLHGWLDEALKKKNSI